MQAPGSALKRTFWRKTPPKSQKWLRDTLGEANKATSRQAREQKFDIDTNVTILIKWT